MRESSMQEIAIDLQEGRIIAVTESQRPARQGPSN
jgi:hypothetical protein